MNLTINGEDEYKTMWGAMMSTIIWIIVIAYTIYRFYYMILRLNPNIARTTLIKTADEDEPFNPQETGFDFAFGLGAPLDPTLGFFTV